MEKRFSVKLVKILSSPFSGGGVVKNHRIQRSGNDGKEKAGPSQDGKGGRLLPEWGFQDADGKSFDFECPLQDSFGKRGVIREGVRKGKYHVKSVHDLNVAFENLCGEAKSKKFRLIKDERRL